METRPRRVYATAGLLAGLAVAALALPRAAAALEARALAISEFQIDPSYRLTPCPPDVYFCGTEIDAPQQEGRLVDDTGTVPSPPQPLTAFSASGYPSGAGGAASYGEGRASASAAGLRARVLAGAGGSTYRLTWRDEQGVDNDIDYFKAARAAAAASATFLDDLTIAGPAGGAAQIRLVLDFERLIQQSGAPVAATATASVAMYGVNPNGTSNTLANLQIVECPNCPAAPRLREAIFFAPVGTWVLSQQLYLDGSAGTSQASPSSGFLIDASHTAQAYLEVLTPGFSFVTASGHDYALPIPEPASGALVAAGLAALARRERRRHPTSRRTGWRHAGA